MMRFSVIQEPTGTWVVFDAIFELPAEIDGRLLIGLNRKEAERAALKANEESYAGGLWVQTRNWQRERSDLRVTLQSPGGMGLERKVKMSFDRDTLNSVDVDRKADGFYYKVHFRGDTLRETGPLKTREEATAAGNRDLAKLEASKSS